MSTSHIRHIGVDELTVDPRVQRQLDSRRVRKLADDWDPHMVGIITVSQRQWEDLTDENGGAIGGEEFVILDGQTRWEAAKLTGVQELRAEIFSGLSEAQEAEIFLRHNDRKAVTPRDRFRLSVVALDEKSLRIRDIAAKHGWSVQGMTPYPKGHKIFTAVQAAEKIYDYDDGKALGKTFEMIERAWGRQNGAVCSETLYGFGTLFGQHPVGVDAARFADKLGKLGLNAFMAAVSDRRRTHPGMSIRTAAAEWTLEIYNRGRRSHRL